MFMQSAMTKVQEKNIENMKRKTIISAPRYAVGDYVQFLLKKIKLDGQLTKKALLETR